MPPSNFRNDPVSQAIENLHSNFAGHDPIRELNRGFGPHEFVDNVFQDVINQTFGRGASERNNWRRLPELQDDFSIDFSGDSFDRGWNRREPVELVRTSRELMNTLDRHASGINIGRHSDRLTKDELKNYIERVGNYISPQDKVDLMLILRDFKQIAGIDGRKDISYRDMASYVMANREADRQIRQFRQEERNESYPTNEEWDWMKPSTRELPQGNARNQHADVSRIITSPNAPHDHFRVEGADIPLSQEAFKEFYGIPENIDLTKFMRTKPNDGQVPNFWTSKVAAGLGGRDGNDLRWDKADYHDPALDFQRNFAQLAEYFDKLPPDRQVEFVFNFARTQGEVLRMHGVKLVAVDNEKIQINENGETYYVDVVQDVGSVKHLLQWLVEK